MRTVPTKLMCSRRYRRTPCPRNSMRSGGHSYRSTPQSVDRKREKDPNKTAVTSVSPGLDPRSPDHLSISPLARRSMPQTPRPLPVVWPRVSLKPDARMRPIVSTGPPAAKGTTMVRAPPRSRRPRCRCPVPMLGRLAGGDIDLSIEPLFPISQEPRRHECAQVRKDVELGDLVVNHQIPESQGHDVPRSDFAELAAVDSRLALLVGRSD